jgi:hypothetical protein
MTVKQLIRKLQHPPCKRIAAVRIEFVDGGIYEHPAKEQQQVLVARFHFRKQSAQFRSGQMSGTCMAQKVARGSNRSAD